MTTDADRQHGEEVRARLAAATAGPWCVVKDEDWEEVSVIRGATNRTTTPNVCTPICTIAQDDDTADADLIAHAPDDLARLLARAEKAEAALARVLRQRRHCGCSWCCADMPPGTDQRGEAHHRCSAARVDEPASTS